MNSSPNQSQRLVAAMCYVSTPIAPLVALRNAKDDPWVERHARQALLWAVPFLLLLVLMIVGMIVLVRADLLFICLLPLAMLLPFVPGAYWARRVYFGGDVTFPIGNRPEPDQRSD